MRTRKTPPPRTQTKRERERGPTRFVGWMCATELKIVGERVREKREREQESGRGGGRVLCIKD